MRFLKQCLQALLSPPLSLPDPARRPPLFQSSTLTESLEQAIAVVSARPPTKHFDTAL